MKKTHPLLVGLDKVKPYPLAEGATLYSIKPPAMQIDQFLPVGGVMGITSYPGVGKTWAAMEVARAVGSGEPFLGKYKTMRGGVLFVGSDSSLYDYARQWTRLTRSLPNPHDTFEPVRFLIQSTFMFEDTDEIRRLIRTHQKFEWGEHRNTDAGPVREKGFHVIIFDTLSRLTRANQNDNTEMEEVFRNIRWLAEATDAAVILLHHNSKKSEFNDGSDWRGAMSQIGALDSWVQLTPSRKDKYLVGVGFKKFRGITPDNFSYRMHVSDAETASLEISDEPVTVEQRLLFDPVARDIREHLLQNPGTRSRDLRDILWPRYEEGVDANGKTLRFETKEKLWRAINNRLNAGLANNTLLREINAEGKPIFYAADEGNKAVSTGDEVSAPSVGGDAPKPKRKKTSKPRKKGKAT